MNRYQRDVHERLQGMFNSGTSHIMAITWYDRNNEETYRWLKEIASKSNCTFSIGLTRPRYTEIIFTRVVEVCPFCGCSPEAQVHKYAEHVKYSMQCINGECPAEGVYTYKEYSSKKAIEMWNTREKT